MDRELLKSIIEEIGAIAIEAVAGKKFATLALKFALSIMTRDFVLDKIIGLFGSNPAAFMGAITAADALRRFGAASPATEPTIEEACAAFDASLTSGA